MRRCIEVVLAALALAPACSTDHGSLVRRPPPNVAGDGGMAGVSGAGGSAATGGTSGSAGTGGTKLVEPPGRAVVTFVHGVVDAPEVLFCFARDGDDGPRFVGDPAPEGGLAYGASMAFESLPGVPVTELTRVFVLAGELELVDELDCASAVERARDEMAAAGLTPAFANLGAAGGGAGGAAGAAGASSSDGGASAGESGEAGASSGSAGDGGASSGGEGGVHSAGAAGRAGEAGDTAAGAGGAPPLPDPPRLRVAELPSLPAGALDDGYSLLYAAHGCLGGPAFSHELEREVCGASYTPKTPTPGAELVTLSRKVDFLHLSLQALHASQALGTLDMRTVPPDDSSMIALSLGSSMTRGALQPKNPRADQRSEDYGISDDGGIALLSAAVVIWEGSWKALSRISGITPVNGRVYTLVVIGPAVEAAPWGFWNPTAVTIVDNDPMLQ